MADNIKIFNYDIYKNTDKADPKQVVDWEAAAIDNRIAEMKFSFFPASLSEAGTAYKFKVSLTEEKKAELEAQNIIVYQDTDESTTLYTLDYIPEHIDIDWYHYSALPSIVQDLVYFITDVNDIDSQAYDDYDGTIDNINSLLISISSLEQLSDALEEVILPEESQS